MTRYTEKKKLDRHHFLAIAKQIRHYADRFDALAESLEKGGHTVEVTHFKTMQAAIDKLRRFLNASLAAHENSLALHVEGTEVMSSAATVDRMPKLRESTRKSPSHEKPPIPVAADSIDVAAKEIAPSRTAKKRRRLKR